ncbi:hypothetical protein KIW84_014083 [Lathyrus oleraceus]|uniref:Uncharacterized protein n=1 Tax=Pisum sativum TaxID=3888 RepID=A0A9D5GYN5_PEA|nr:hypothetical protein KIW84_014083 [Pisum sativum]
MQKIKQIPKPNVYAFDHGTTKRRKIYQIGMSRRVASVFTWPWLCDLVGGEMLQDWCLSFLGPFSILSDITIDWTGPRLLTFSSSKPLESLVLDRICKRYWRFITSASQSDPGRGRICVEFQDGWCEFYFACLETKHAGLRSAA